MELNRIAPFLFGRKPHPTDWELAEIEERDRLAELEERGPGRTLTRFVNGRHVPITLLTSGQEARHERRRAAIDKAKGQRKYNRAERKKAYIAGTRRAQLAILKDEVEVTPDMRRNLERAIQVEQERNEREATAPARAQQDVARRQAQLNFRRVARFEAGQPRGKDLRLEVFREYAFLLPLDYAGKWPS
jgi:hypothetical protein